MSQQHRHEISWQGHHVGYINDARQDMWYLEGTWEALESEHTSDFLKLTAHLTFKEWLSNQDNDKFIWLSLDDAEPTWVFFGFLDELICLRLVTSIKPPIEE
jgi:hypothetical protein